MGEAGPTTGFIVKSSGVCSDGRPFLEAILAMLVEGIVHGVIAYHDVSCKVAGMASQSDSRHLASSLTRLMRCFAPNGRANCIVHPAQTCTARLGSSRRAT